MSCPGTPTGTSSRRRFGHRSIAYRIDGPVLVNNHAHVLRAACGIDQSFLSILTGVRPTVAAASEATGLSVGSSTNALRFLADKGLLEAKVGRGPGSGSILADPAGLLDAYSGAGAELPDQLSLQVGVAWRDPPAGLVEVGRRWDEAWIRWVATGAVAATAIAPFLTSIGSTEAYVDAETIPGLEAVAAAVGLRAIEGGRLTLRPCPTTSVLRLAETVDGLRVAPWPRVYVDLMRVGVRGESRWLGIVASWPKSYPPTSPSKERQC